MDIASAYVAILMSLEAIARTHKVLAMKDYIRYRLTYDFVTDDIEAMGFMLLDVNKNK